MKYKKYTKADVKKFCDDNFIEEFDWLWKFVKNAEKCNIQMINNVLVVRIAEDEEE